MKRQANVIQEKTFFKRLVRVLREADSASESFKSEKGQISIDQQIDRYFAQFESEAGISKNESYFRGFRLLKEEGEDELGGDDELSVDDALGGDEEEPADDAPGGGDEGESADAEEGDESAEEAPPEKLGIDSLDVFTFSNGIARLIDNYDSMLEFKNTILRRALNFIRKSYTDDVVDELKNVLAEEHGLEYDRSKFDREDTQYAAPSAQRAGGTGGGSA